MSDASDRAEMLLANARAALDREGQLLDVVGALTDEIKYLWHDLAELHDAHLALSNRIEAVTRTVGGDLPQMGSPAMYNGRMRAGSKCPRCDVFVQEPAHSCSVSRANYVVSP